jgi:hypothetical protein
MIAQEGELSVYLIQTCAYRFLYMVMVVCSHWSVLNAHG